MNDSLIVNDVTRLNPTAVWSVVTPRSITDVQDTIRRTTGPISVGGGRFSMGGQVASPGSLHLDMRSMNRILEFSPARKTIRVEPGVRWCDIQRFVDPHGLSVKVMQTYANFTVGGSLSVNCHGRYIGLGPLILSVREVVLVLANGEVVHASRSSNPEIFYGTVGGYGAIGVIVEAELDLADNTRLERVDVKMPISKYATHFRDEVRDAGAAVFHNADIYPPHYEAVRSVSWVVTTKGATERRRLQRIPRKHWIERYFMWAITETPFGKWRREFIVDPLVYRSPKVHWRNYEAGYDVRELEPPSRAERTYVLQEYFVPVERFDEFVPKMREILRRHRVNVVNISIRHAFPDPGSLLAWARTETFAFVLYYKQRTRQSARERVAVWTRELIDAVLSVGGAYYLPYQPHATHEQFHAAYPRAKELFALKGKLDPEFRFRNVLWDKYYVPASAKPASKSEFHTVYSNVESADAFYLFLQNVYHLYPEDRFHALIKEACRVHHEDAAIYRYIQERLRTIKPFLSELTYAIPSLRKQKAEMLRQTLELLGSTRSVNGYVEIGTTGRYAGVLRKRVDVRGPIYLVNDAAPSNSPVDILERGGLRKIGTYVPLADYEPLAIPDASVDLITCFIGLHHCDPSRLDAFIRSIARVLRPGGVFIVRDHDVTTEPMRAFVSLAHAVFNAGLGVPWDVNQREPRFFESIATWKERLAAAGFTDSGARLLQAHDPSFNNLMRFVK